MKRDLEVNIILPVWNGAKLLQANLPEVIAAAENPKNGITEIIVVDDKSTDGSAELVKQRFGSQIKIVRHKKNRGFSATVNTGVRTAKGDIVCLLNQDVWPKNNFLEQVLLDFNDPKVFGVSMHEAGHGPAIGEFTAGFVNHAGGEETDKIAQTFWISGGSGCFRRKTWMELGGLDENLLSPFYWEDVDLGYRALKQGYKLLWEPASEVVHSHESTINVSNFKKAKLDLIKERNQLLFMWKNITSANLMKKHFSGLVKRIFEHPGYIKVVIAALPRLPMALKKRKVEIKGAKVSDETIFARFQK